MGPHRFEKKIFVNLPNILSDNSDKMQLLGDNYGQNAKHDSHTVGMTMNVTDKDRDLLDILSENGRMPVAALAKKLSLSRTTVQARLERLEQEGVIAGYGVRLSDAYSSRLARAYVMITLAPKALTRVCIALQQIHAIKSLHSVSGTFDLIAILEAPSISELDQYVDKIGMVDGVERTLSSIILSTRISR